MATIMQTAGSWSAPSHPITNMLCSDSQWLLHIIADRLAASPSTVWLDSETSVNHALLSWIPRGLNGFCDSLAKAVSAGGNVIHEIFYDRVGCNDFRVCFDGSWSRDECRLGFGAAIWGRHTTQSPGENSVSGDWQLLEFRGQGYGTRNINADNIVAEFEGLVLALQLAVKYLR